MCTYLARTILSALSLVASAAMAGSPAWTSVPIFGQAPLEAKLGTFTTGSDPDVLGVVLWNDGASNRLDAIRVPPPYDGTGITTTPLENTANLFALGDICTLGSNVVVPYIKNFNIEYARFNGVSWSTATVPGTTTNSFTTTDCATTPTTMVISGQNFNTQKVAIFKSTTGGASFSLAGEYSPVVGPFSGAARDQLLASPAGGPIFSFSQAPSGQIRVNAFDIDDSPLVFTPHNIVNLPAPPGSFTVVRESGAGLSPAGRAYFTYNADNNARTIDFPISDPADFTARNLGTINNTGTQFQYQGGAVVYIGSKPGETHVFWADAFVLPNNGASAIDPTYPNAGVGGPVDGCAVHYSRGGREIALVVPSVGSAGTELLFHDEPISGIFLDGFESGDTSSWSCC